MCVGPGGLADRVDFNSFGSIRQIYVISLVFKINTLYSRLRILSESHIDNLDESIILLAACYSQLWIFFILDFLVIYCMSSLSISFLQLRGGWMGLVCLCTLVYTFKKSANQKSKIFVKMFVDSKKKC
jgi:hypothetical protein